MIGEVHPRHQQQIKMLKVVSNVLNIGTIYVMILHTIKSLSWSSSLWTKLVFLCLKYPFSDPVVSSLVFLYLFCKIHVTGVSTYPSGAPGLISISEIYVFTQFCHIEGPTDLRLRNTGIPHWYCCTLILSASNSDAILITLNLKHTCIRHKVGQFKFWSSFYGCFQGVRKTY